MTRIIWGSGVKTSFKNITSNNYYLEGEYTYHEAINNLLKKIKDNFYYNNYNETELETILKKIKNISITQNYSINTITEIQEALPIFENDLVDMVII